MVKIGPPDGGGSSGSNDTSSSDDDGRSARERVEADAGGRIPDPEPAPDPAPPPAPEPAPAPEPEPAPPPEPDPASTPSGGAPSPDIRDATREAIETQRDARRDTTSAERQQAAADQQDLRESVARQTDLNTDDIRFVDRTGDRLQPELTREGRENVVREQFRETRQETRRLAQFPGVDREQAVPLSQFADDEIRAEATAEGVSIGPTEEAAEEFVRQEAREQAAAQAPLRDSDEFIVDDGQVRQRADPFFDEQRDALGVDLLPGQADDALTTDRGESRIRLGLRDAAEAWNRGVTSDRFGDPTAGESAVELFGDQYQGETPFAGAEEQFNERYATALNPAAAVLDTVGMAEQGANIVQAEAETRAEMFDAAGDLQPEDVADRTADVGPFGTDLRSGDTFGLPEDGPFVEDAGEPVNPFGLAVPEGSAAAEERAETTAAAEQGVEAAAEQAQENPVGFLGTLAGGATFGVATGIGIGAAGRTATVAARSRLATRGARGDVDFGAIERPDVRSGQSRLTRFSEESVPGGKRSMPTEDFPVEPSSSPAVELQNLADEYETPGIRDRLEAGEGESTLFSARSGRKPERFELRSGRPYDPDAAFFAGSVSRNFLDVGRTPSGGFGGFRLPRPFSAARSIGQAARGDSPSILATAGRIDELPGNVRTRGEITEFLESEANTGRFFTRQSDNQSGEAEAVTAAEGAESTVDPLPGAGQIEPGDATEFVEVARPMQTEVGGEGIPIQFVRQDTGDVTPLSQQSLYSDFLADERGQLSAGGVGRGGGGLRGIQQSTRSDVPYTPGGAPGRPVAPVPPSGSGLPGTEYVDSTTFDVDASTPFYEADGFASTSPRDGGSGSRRGRDRDRDAPPSSGSVLPGSSGDGLPGSSVGGPPSSGSTPPSSGSPGAPPSSPGSPPGSPAGPPSSPFGVPPSPGSPFGPAFPPSSPPASPPPGASQPAPPSTPPVFGSGDTRPFDEEPEFFEFAPQTPEFTNPVVDVFSGGFGGFGTQDFDAEGGGRADGNDLLGGWEEGTFGAGWF
jgi:hypothetical protein